MASAESSGLGGLRPPTSIAAGLLAAYDQSTVSGKDSRNRSVSMSMNAAATEKAINAAGQIIGRLNESGSDENAAKINLLQRSIAFLRSGAKYQKHVISQINEISTRTLNSKNDGLESDKGYNDLERDLNLANGVSSGEGSPTMRAGAEEILTKAREILNDKSGIVPNQQQIFSAYRKVALNKGTYSETDFKNLSTMVENAVKLIRDSKTEKIHGKIKKIKEKINKIQAKRDALIIEVKKLSDKGNKTEAAAKMAEVTECRKELKDLQVEGARLNAELDRLIPKKK